MKIFIPKAPWIGNYFKYFESAFKDHSVEFGSNNNDFRLNSVISILKLRQITWVRIHEMKHYLRIYNEKVIEDCTNFNPDIFIVFNESKLYPDTISRIKERTKCRMVCLAADDPWDSTRFKTDFPHSLKYFDFIFVGEPTWSVNIRKVAPDARIYWNWGGVDPEIYFPVDRTKLTPEDIITFSCDISFTGSSYGSKAEGAYRSDILSYLTEYDLRIWGDDNWPYRFRYLPQIKNKYKGTRLSYEALRKLYALSKINLNLPAPQIVTGFQPRVFDIAAVKGFQIADNRKMIRTLFSEDELVTFDTIDELREKINYYLKNEEERTKIAQRLHEKVLSQYTWKHWAQQILDTVQNPERFEQLIPCF